MVSFDDRSREDRGWINLLIKGSNWAAERLEDRRAGTIRGHVNNVLVGSGCAYIAVGYGIDGFAEPIALYFNATFRAEVGTDENKSCQDGNNWQKFGIHLELMLL